MYTHVDRGMSFEMRVHNVLQNEMQASVSVGVNALFLYTGHLTQDAVPWKCCTGLRNGMDSGCAQIQRAVK
jgi:hypothetical protein